MTEPGRADGPGTPRPGKIIAVHAGYASRAAESGTRPAHPSYFLKPASSLADSGGEVERPPGTEQLTCEGEIALVIGTAARRIGRDEAWSCVRWVTAANDLGVGELRAQDHGSLLRSKGGDGFTPLGPALLDAAAVDPGGLRVRTWVNGRLVQQDTTAGLLFPLTQILADLSQHLTLEPGDVVLTGTPAGSRVLAPGDEVEVEVDDVATGAATGRLRTTVTAGSVPYDPALGALPAPPARPSALDPDTRAKLARTPVAALSAQLRKRGLDNVHIDGPRPLTPGARIVGTARTLRFLPAREDLFATHGGGHNAQKRAFDAVGEGEVLVIEARGERAAATLGDILAIRAHARGAAGIVTDGAVRDAEAVAAVGIPVFANGAHPAVLGRKHVPWDTDLAVACGGATVLPGDVVVADADGAVVVPVALAAEVADAALAQEDEDAWTAEQARAGHALDGLFPMDTHWRARYAQRGEAQ
ncbi:fumarylacetoacetate hydrolase family protein [Kitasatospora phosalacinea]|uniref:fumarylacetoacetate hydrolase family protein n=1 Tax=Kitasatospora phosalacinea TaxID=2065 RepID=UPI00364BFE0E